MKFLCTLALLLTCICRAGAVYYKVYTTSDNLPGNNVYHIYRDHQGYLWMATDNGISRYDGLDFKTYTVLNGIGDNNVFNFHEDRQHRLWLYTYNGTPCFIKNDSVFNAANTPFLKQMPALSYINAMYDADDTTLYIGYIDGTVAQLRDTNYRQLLTGSITGNRLTTIYQVQDTIRIICSTLQTDMVHDRVTANRHMPTANSFFYNGFLLLSDSKGISIWRNNRMAWRLPAAIAPSEVIHLYYDTMGRLFCSSPKGLFIFNTRSGYAYQLFKNLKTSSVTQDMYGNYWISTLGNGIFRLNREPEAIKRICALNTGKVTYTRAGQFFYTRDGIVCTIGQNGNERKIKKPDKQTAAYDILHYDSTLLICNNQKRCIITVSHYPGYKTDSLNERMKYVHVYDKNKLLAWNRDNILSIDASGKTLAIKKIMHLQERLTESCFNPDKGILYYLCRQSLYTCNAYTGTTQLLDTITGTEAVAGMHMIGDHLILSTNNRHFIIYRHGSAQEKMVFSAGETALFDVVPVDTKTWLLYTNKGYYLFCPGSVSPFTSCLQELEYPFRQQDVSFLYPSGNHIVCSVNDVLYTFEAALLNRELAIPVLQVKKITVDGTDYTNRNIVIKGRNNSQLFVQLTGPAFSNATIFYQYRLVQSGITGPWVSEYNREFVIPAERPGDYRIDIRSITQNNRASAVYSFTLQLTPPFYGSVLFYILLLLATVLLVYTIVHWYHIRRRKALQEEMNYMQLEHKAINSLLNPHFVFNAINNIQHLINGNDKQSANHYLATMSRMIRQNMENLQFNLIPVSKEMQLTEHYVQLQNLRFDGKIGLEAHIDIGAIEDVLIPPLLIHTFVENAIVHGFRRGQEDFLIQVELFFSTDNYLVISVRDNGTGLKKKEEVKPVSPGNAHKSMGVDFTRTRLKRLSDFYNVSYSLDIQDLCTRGEKGTQVIIVLYGKFKELIAGPVR